MVIFRRRVGHRIVLGTYVLITIMFLVDSMWCVNRLINLLRELIYLDIHDP